MDASLAHYYSPFEHLCIIKFKDLSSDYLRLLDIGFRERYKFMRLSYRPVCKLLFRKQDSTTDLTTWYLLMLFKI